MQLVEARQARILHLVVVPVMLFHELVLGLRPAAEHPEVAVLLVEHLEVLVKHAMLQKHDVLEEPEPTHQGEHGVVGVAVLVGRNVPGRRHVVQEMLGAPEPHQVTQRLDLLVIGTLKGDRVISIDFRVLPPQVLVENIPVVPGGRVLAHKPQLAPQHLEPQAVD